MNFQAKICWAVAGFAAATAIGAIVDPIAARAQGVPSSRATISPPPRPTLVPQRRVATPAAENPDPYAAPVSSDADQPMDEADADDNGEQDAPADRVGRGQRGVVRDGDPSNPVPGDQNRDGVADIGEPRGPVDGADPSLVDSRAPEDAALFDSPPAGFDPRLFDAEVEPILDRRPLQLYRFEPFTAKGIKVGSFVLLPEAEIATAWFSNVFRSSTARSDTALQLRPSARLVSNWRTHALEFNATGLASYFSEFSTENDRAYALEARGRIDISRRTNIEGAIGREVTQESRSSIDAVQGAGRRSDVTTDRGVAAFNHRFNRLSVQLRGAVSDFQFGDTDNGGAIANSNRNYKVYEEAIRTTWEFKPTLFGFIEAGLNQREHAAIASADGFKRDSTGERYRIGVSFGNTSQRLRGEASVGYAMQRPDERQLQDIAGVIVDANIAYKLNGLTTFLLSARSDISETTLAGSGGALVRQVGIEARHAFLRQLIGTAGLSYGVQNYEGVDLDEREFRAGLGLEYFVNSDVIVFGNYQHTVFNSTDRGRNYDADDVRVGLRLRR